jgi:hypothetical protein
MAVECGHSRDVDLHWELSAETVRRGIAEVVSGELAPEGHDPGQWRAERSLGSARHCIHRHSLTIRYSRFASTVTVVRFLR